MGPQEVQDAAQGIPDKATLIASFAGAVAYLCTRDKIPIVVAIVYVVSGTCVAVYVGPAITEVIKMQGYSIHQRVSDAITFLVGVGGIWVLNLVVALLQAFRNRAGLFVERLIDRIFGFPGGPPAPPGPPPPGGGL